MPMPIIKQRIDSFNFLRVAKWMTIKIKWRKPISVFLEDLESWNERMKWNICQQVLEGQV